MTDKELRPWDIWLQNNNEDFNGQNNRVNNPEPTQTPVNNPEVREVKPWDLLNPNKVRASEEDQQTRLAICKKCPSYRKFAKQCKECGCIMPAKVKLAEAFCPLNKWEAVEGIE